MHGEPRVLDGLLTGQAFLLIDNKKLGDQIFALFWDLLEFDVIEMEFCFLDLPEDLMWIGSLEWQVSRHKGVQKDTKWPEISFLTIGAFQDFWGHVVRGSSHSGEILIILWCFRKTEVDQSDWASLSDHDILWLDISMDDVASMTMIDSSKQVLHVASGNLFIESLVLLGCDHLEELEALDILHHQVDVLLVIVSLVVLYNVGVVQLVENSNFLHNAVNVVL